MSQVSKTLSEADFDAVSELGGSEGDSNERYSLYLKTLNVKDLQEEAQGLYDLMTKTKDQIEAIEKELEDRHLPLEERLKRLTYPELEAILDEKVELRKTVEGEERDSIETWIIAALLELRRRRSE
jgi:hypothetical protein